MRKEKVRYKRELCFVFLLGREALECEVRSLKCLCGQGGEKRQGARGE